MDAITQDAIVQVKEATMQECVFACRVQARGTMANFFEHGQDRPFYKKVVKNSPREKDGRRRVVIYQ
jgi:hypothetical protein